MSHKHDILLVSRDRDLAASLAEAVRTDPDFALAPGVSTIEEAVEPAALTRAAIIIVDLDAGRRDHLLALQALMARAAGKPVAIVTGEACSEAVQRWLLQVRVHDYMRKPLDGGDLIASCRRLLLGSPEPPSNNAFVVSFLPAAGGVGNTTLAVEAAMQFLKDAAGAGGVALVDLDLHNDACADFLDLEPRLNFSEIGESGKRLDPQLLEAMTSRHSSGLALIAAPSLAGQMRDLQGSVLLRLLDVVSASFAHVVIDLPRMWNPWTDGILMGSDRTFVVTDMTVPGLRFARRIADQVNGRLALKNPLRVIVNRAERRFLFGTGLRRADAARALEGVFAGDVPNNYQLVREAIDQGVPLEAVKPGNNVSASMKRILFARPQQERPAS